MTNYYVISNAAELLLKSAPLYIRYTEGSIWVGVFKCLFSPLQTKMVWECFVFFCNIFRFIFCLKTSLNSTPLKLDVKTFNFLPKSLWNRNPCFTMFTWCQNCTKAFLCVFCLQQYFQEKYTTYYIQLFADANKNVIIIYNTQAFVAYNVQYKPTIC